MPVNWGASPRSACNQHFSAAQGTRKHLNALIYDRVQVRPPPPPLLSARWGASLWGEQPHHRP